MQSLRQEAETRAANLYWLAFLLTGDREASESAAVDAAEFRALANCRSRERVLRSSRRVAISKALGAIRHALGDSARRTEAGMAELSSHAPHNWTMDSQTSKLELERALLAVDVFPRCVLVLSVLEGLSLEEVAILVDEDAALVREALPAALENFMGNAFSLELQRPAAIGFAGFGEMPHA